MTQFLVEEAAFVLLDEVDRLQAEARAENEARDARLRAMALRATGRAG